MDFEQRLNGLHDEMARRDLDLAVYGLCPEFQYLTGLPLDWRADAGPAAELFVPREGAPALVLDESLADMAGQTWIEDIRTPGEGAIGVTGVTGGEIAVGGRVSQATAERLRPTEPCDAKGLMDGLRMIKEPEEVERLRAVACLTDRVLGQVVPLIGQGVTQPELEGEVALQGRRLGASGVSFPPAAKFTLSGSAPSPEPFTYPAEKGLVAGTSIAFDIGFVMDGYCSDHGRSFYLGEAPEAARRAYEALQQAMLETVEKMWDGSMRCCDVFPAFEKTLDRLGYGDYLRARLPDSVIGHNIGIDVHENPWLRPDSAEPLRAGMVMALEPKLWHAGEYYLRVEDIVLVGQERSEFLTGFSRDVFELPGRDG